MFPYFEIFGKKIGLYGICVVLGCAAVALMFRKLYKLRGMNGYDLALAGVISSLGIFLGAHLLYGITQIPLLGVVIKNFHSLVHSFSDFFNWMGTIFGGMVFYGGMLGGMLVGYIYVKKAKLDKNAYFDIFAPAIPLFHAFGRIGCFLSGCCYGIESKFGFTYTWSVNEAANGVRRFPVQLLESLLNFMLAALLIYLFKKKYHPGKLMRIYFLTYPVIRFFDEFLRGDEIRGFWGPFSTSQWISLALFLLAIVWLLADKVFVKKNKISSNQLQN